MVFKAILDAIEKLKESLLSKVGEKTADYVLNASNNIMDYEPIVKTLENNLKLLSAKASDVEEQIKNAELSGNKKRKREVEEWLRQVKSIDAEWGTHTEPEGLMRRLEDGGTPARLNQQVEKLVQQSWNFGELLLDVCGNGRVALVTTKMVGKAFQENLEKICRLMETGEKSFIALHGMGGTGKTTLAMHIHNLLLEQSPGCVIWVTVSQGINIKSLQDKITSSLGVKNLLDGDDEVIRRAGKLHEALSKMNNPVLILDDVWENINLSELGCTISKEGCRLIITTRSLEVCHRIGCEEVIEVEKLNEDEAWNLFIETLGKETKLDPQVEDTARIMAKLCGGLPLGLVTLGGSMRGETSICKWRNAVVELREPLAGHDGMEEVEVFKVLRQDRLNKNGESERSEFNLFQLCFLYCSLYPEDHEIPREELVRNLISEGLLQRRKTRREQVDQGHIIVDKLVKVCLLESCVYECVKMHDLVRGMALKIGGEKYMVRAGDRSLKEIPMEQEWTEQLEKVSLMRNCIMRIGEGTSPNCPNLSTLLLQGNYELQFIPDPFFCRMQGLHTLDLSRTQIKMLPNSISELKSLEALLLEWCNNIKHVPNLGKLKALRELDLSDTAIKEVPQGVEELLNLKFLSFYETHLKELPTGLLHKLVGLQILRLPPLPLVATEEIHKQVEEFRGRVGNVSEFNSFITSRVHDHTIYRIEVGSLVVVEDCEDYEDYEDYDKLVTLGECNLEDEKVLGQGIKCLTIVKCHGMSRCLLNNFSRFHNLRRLRIEGCGGVEYILGSEPELASGFSTLEEIKLSSLKDLKGLVESERASAAPPLVVFSSLIRLHIDKCDSMRRLGLSLSEFPKLDEIEIRRCDEIEEIFKDELGRGGGGRKKEEIGGASAAPPQPALLSSSLTKLFILGCNKMRKLGISVLEVPNLEYIDISNCSKIEEIFEDHQGTGSDVALPKLQELSLGRLPRLKSVCKAPIICNSILRISIFKCIKMKKLGIISVSGFPNLLSVNIAECLEIEEIFEDEGTSSKLDELKVLSLKVLPRLKSVCKAPIICNSIKHITIRKCPRLMKKLPLHLDDPPPPCLKRIVLCPEWWKSLEWDNPNLPTLLQPILSLSEIEEDESDDISSNPSSDSETDV